MAAIVRTVLLVTLGDVLLDVVVRLGDPLVPGADVPATIRTGTGGQAANVAAWAAELGASARCVAKRGVDQAGELVGADLAARGVEAVGPTVPSANGVVVSIVGPDGDRTMASDRGVAPDLRPEELDSAWFAGADVLHLSGYSLLRSPIDAAASRAAALAREAKVRVSVDLSAWPALRAFGPVRFRERLDALAPDVVFANEAEWEIVGGSYLPAPLAVIKRGGRGITIVSQEARLDLAAAGGDVVDATGAGDALAAGFLLGGSLEEAGRRGLETAARCVAQLGAMP
jgi:sugar/nucleoside kinase (ribokinase family)